MRRFLVSSVFTLLAALLQSTVLSGNAWRWLNITPDISMITLVFFSLSFGRMNGQLSGYAGGLLEDFLSGAPIGFHALLKMLLGAGFGSLKGIYVESVPIAMLVIAIATAIKYVVYMILSFIFGLRSMSAGLFSASFVFEIIINALLAVPLFLFIRLIIKKLSFLWQWESVQR